MSANVEPVEMFLAECEECYVSCFYLYEPAAKEWAATHDAENHGDNGTNDDDYEQFKEARGI